MIRRISCSGVFSSVHFTRSLHWPLSPPPIQVKYLDEDPLEFALRQEARHYGLDDFDFSRELAFVRINDNPTVGEFRYMTSEGRANMFYGSNRQDFYRYFTWKVLGDPEHLYHFRTYNSDRNGPVFVKPSTKRQNLFVQIIDKVKQWGGIKAKTNTTA